MTSDGEEVASMLAKLWGWLELLRRSHLQGSPRWQKLTEGIGKLDAEFHAAVEQYGLDEAIVARLLRIKGKATELVAQQIAESN